MFLVYGATGEYDDYTEWPVAAFTSKPRAQTWARRANEWTKAHGLHDHSFGRVGRSFGNPYDPNMDVDYTGTRYYVTERLPLDPPLPR